MVVKCKIIETAHKHDDTSQIITYGLAFYYAEASEKIIKSIEDIFIDKKKAEALKELINANALHKVHIDDVIEDAIVR